MELVQGVPITDYCDQTNLTTRERLELFITVCQAVQHAHQKGVIHRDIKPTNVLVAMQDGKPAPKIIDFGVAKALNQRLTEHTLATGYAQMIGTPLYMSPEQAELSPLGADTRSDIYSLGVLLYELLTGTTPFDKDRLHAAGYDELRRILREEDPPRPSTRLSTLDAQLATTVADRRRTDANHLRQSVRGELDWIVMKCLEKDRNRRYETASSVARDVERFLRDEPVLACPPSAAYRLKKFARRNRVALITAGIVAAALVIGISASISQAIRATRAESIAQVRLREASEARAEAEISAREARQAVDEMYTEVAERWLAHEPRMEPIQREFLQNALRFYTRFAQEGGSQSDVLLETARAHRRVADIQHRLGEPALAETPYRRAVDQYQSLIDQFPNVTAYRVEQAATLHKLGVLLGDTSRSSEEEQVHRRALAVERKLLAESPDAPDRLRDVGRGHWYLGQVLLALQRLTDAEDELRAALEFQGQLVREFPTNRDYRHHLAQTHLRLGLTLGYCDRLEECHYALESAAAILESLAAEFPKQLEYRNELANVYYWDAHYYNKRNLAFAQISGQLNRAIALQEQLVADHPYVTDYRYDLLRSQDLLGRTLLNANETSDAEVALRHAATIAEKLVADAPNVPYYRGGLAYVHKSLGRLFAATDRPADAEAAYRQAIGLLSELVEESPAVPHYRQHLAETYKMLADVLTAAGRIAEAEQARLRASRIVPSAAPATDIDETLHVQPEEPRAPGNSTPVSRPARDT